MLLRTLLVATTITFCSTTLNAAAAQPSIEEGQPKKGSLRSPRTASSNSPKDQKSPKSLTPSSFMQQFKAFSFNEERRLPPPSSKNSQAPLPLAGAHSLEATSDDQGFPNFSPRNRKCSIVNESGELEELDEKAILAFYRQEKDKIKSLNLSFVTNHVLNEIFTLCTLLESVTLTNCEVSEESINLLLENCKKLKDLTIIGESKINSAYLQGIKNIISQR